MKGFIIALQFMTRIPLFITIEMDNKDFGRSSRFFPLVGLVIGTILALAYYFANWFFPPLVLGALILILEIIITGGIHFDGFIDTMDGILSARPRERVFEIMKDSRVGAHGVTALLCLVLLKFSLLVSLSSSYILFILLLMPVLGRWAMVFCLAFFPYAKPEGLGKIFWEETDKVQWYLITGLIFLLSFIFLPNVFLIIFVITLLVALTPMLLINKKLQGHTGDTYGAINEITEVIFLLICLLVL
ncbi:MAG: adenosylcobinamide-GDP ribazoletransferase [Clostridia bacterium]|nr:adenosylcobinamide-GDP ribazoletransferase [Clostridia bacterium]